MEKDWTQMPTLAAQALEVDGGWGPRTMGFRAPVSQTETEGGCKSRAALATVQAWEERRQHPNPIVFKNQKFPLAIMSLRRALRSSGK